MKKDWTVWLWNANHWERATTCHADWWVRPKKMAERIARGYAIDRKNARVLPAGREPKGRPR